MSKETRAKKLAETLTAALAPQDPGPALAQVAPLSTTDLGAVWYRTECLSGEHRSPFWQLPAA